MKVSLHLWVVLWAVVFVYTAGATPTVITSGVFDITFYHTGDNNGQLVGVQDWTAEQMADVVSATQQWSSRIGNTPGRQISMHAFWNEMDNYGQAVLGGSSSHRTSDGTTISTYCESVWKDGTALPAGDYGYDALIRYDVTAGGGSWNFGMQAPMPGQIDFRSVVTHELGHSLGFKSSYDYSFDDWGFIHGKGYSGITAWDKNLIDITGNKPQKGSTGSPGNFDERGGVAYWDGEFANALYGEQVPIYAPYPWRSGASLTHLDEGLLGNLLMSPYFDNGQMIRQVSELEWAMMADMGWTIIPEPATLLLLGLGATTLLRKRHLRPTK